MSSSPLKETQALPTKAVHDDDDHKSKRPASPSSGGEEGGHEKKRKRKHRSESDIQRADFRRRLGMCCRQQDGAGALRYVFLSHLPSQILLYVIALLTVLIMIPPPPFHLESQYLRRSKEERVCIG